MREDRLAHSGFLAPTQLRTYSSVTEKLLAVPAHQREMELKLRAMAQDRGVSARLGYDGLESRGSLKELSQRMPCLVRRCRRVLRSTPALRAASERLPPACFSRSAT